MELVVGKIVEKLGQEKWGQVHDFTPEDEGKIMSRGRLIATISLEITPEEGQVQAVAAGRETLSRLQELYYGEAELSAMERLKTAVTAMGQEFSGLELAAAAVLGETIYVVTGGGAGVWVNIGPGKRGWLVKPGGGTGEYQIRSFSGRLTEGEVIVMGTHGFWSVVSERLLATAVEKMESNFQEAVEMVISEVQGGEGESGGAGVLIKVQSSKFGVQSLEEEKVQEPITRESTESPVSKKWMELAKRLAGRIYVRQGDKQEQRKKMMYAGIGFLVVVSLFFGGGQIWNQRKKLAGSEVTKTIEKIQYDFNEAKAMAGLNPARSRELLTGVKQNIEGIAGKKDEKLAAIEKEWQGVWNEAAGITQTKLEEILDLGLVRDGMIGKKMAKLEDKLYVLDDKSGKLAEVNIKTGAGNIAAAGDGLTGARQVTTYPGRILILGDQGIWEVSGGKSQVRVKGDEIIAAARDMKMWAGNIYLLEVGKEGGTIWRYQASGEGFSGGKNWLTEGKIPGLANGVAMAIDGSIWITDGTKILKYTRGATDNFELTGLGETAVEISVLYTDENSDNLYLLDKSKSRIIVINKKGEYQKQLQAAELGQAADMVIDEKAGVGYILAQNKVWQITL